ncbi:MAG: folylpolyglutamate synthase/dihydrofolate synthase family protein [Fimbriimonas sp.]
MTYEEAVAYIASLEPRGWRLGLDRMREFVWRAGLQDAVGAPGGPQFIHVAGTNGKGSTTAYLQSLFVESGFATGAFFSPYVVDPRERIQFGRELIPKDEFAQLTEELIPVGESLSETSFGGITEFEFKAALGFLFWKRRRCDWVALEVGLGGRLDATNVVQPRATIIVSISMDHMQFLGSTLAAIAYEKAGILKEGVPCMVGPLPEEAMKAVDVQARSVGAPLWRFGHEILWEDGTVVTPHGRHQGVVPGIAGAKQEINLALAIASLDAAGIKPGADAIRKGAAKAFAPGRFQQVEVGGKAVLFDGAHNGEAAEVLRVSFDRSYPGKQMILVTNMLEGHELRDFYGPLMARAAHVVPIDFHRARPVSVTAKELKVFVPEVMEHASVGEGLRAALERATEADVVVVTGSFYLVGEALRG